jgi:very-short-patch-repair endonuclease
VPVACGRKRDGVLVHRRPGLRGEEVFARHRIPVTSLVRTMIDISRRLETPDLERAVNEADRLDLIDPESLLDSLGAYRGQRGVRALQALLSRHVFRFTDSELERRFLRLVERAGLPLPVTGIHLNGFKVDFYWPHLGLVVETDGLRYHRTPAQQARDRLRDQAHVAGGLTALRFTHAQVRDETRYVIATMRAVATRLEEGWPDGDPPGLEASLAP